MRGWLAALFAALIGMCSAAVALAPDVPGDPERGAALFAKSSCQGCHGVGAIGGTSPPLVGPEWKYGGDPASIAKSIRGGHMPLMLPMGGETLTNGQVDDLVAYLKHREATLTAQERAVATSNTATGAPKGIVHSAVQDFRVETVAKVGPPYAFDFLPDGRILINETGGALRVVDHGKLLPQPIIGTPTGNIAGMKQWFRRGSLSLAVHPNYKANGWIYLMTARAAADPKPGTSPEIATIYRGRIRDGHWVDSQKIIEFPIETTDSLRMKFDAKGLLYVGTPYSDEDYTGDDHYAPGQDVARPEGKILRMRDDGSVPPDNPFVATPGAYPYVWSYGHREPSGLTFDGKGKLWNVEDGPRGGDELNHVRKGHNYGWPVITWGHRYDAKPVASHTEHQGMEQPVVNWTPSPALSDIEWYGGSAFPRWTGSFFIGSMKQKDLFRVTVDGDRATLVETVLHNVDRLRDIATGPDGMIYVLTDSGDLLRLVPATARAASH
jgi:glucose/arabinose dehydrogenase